MFSYATAASVKGPAEHDVVLLMFDQILQDGFVTVYDPLLVIQNETLSKGEEAGSHV